MEDEDEFLFEALLQEHKTQQEFKSLPSRIVVVEGLKAATAHLDRRPADSSSSREESSTSTSGSRREGSRSGRRSGGSASTGDVDMRELHDSLIKLFSPFGSVTYVNEHLFAAEDALFVFFTHIRDAQEAKEEVEKDLRKHLRPVINTLGPHVEKGEPDWSAVKIRYEEPKTLALPVTAGHKSSRHLWVGSIDDTVVTSATLEAVFGAFGTLTDRPHINVGRQQGFVDFQTVYEAVDALTHMNGVFLGCLPLEIRFGRQEFGKVLWIGGLDDTMTERRLWQACYDWGMVKSVAIHASKQCASITFSAPEEAQLALDMMQGVRIGSCKLKVDYFRTARTFPGPEFSSPTVPPPFSPTLRSGSKGRGSVPPTSPPPPSQPVGAPPASAASSAAADRDKDQRERERDTTKERERERERELAARGSGAPPKRHPPPATATAPAPAAPVPTVSSSTSASAVSTPVAAELPAGTPSVSTGTPPLPSNLALSSARPQKRKAAADDRLPGASSASAGAQVAEASDAGAHHHRRKREKLDVVDTSAPPAPAKAVPAAPAGKDLSPSTTSMPTATMPSPPPPSASAVPPVSSSSSSSSLASSSPSSSSSSSDRRREGTPPHRYFVPSPEEWYIPGSSKRADTERGGGGGGLSVSGGRGEPSSSSSAWNPPPREREPLPPPPLAGGGRMAPLKSRSAEWSDAGGRGREWSDVAPAPLPPPRGGPRDWDRGGGVSREWTDRGGGIGISGGSGRDGGRGGIPPPHAYPPFSPPPFKPRGRLPGHRRGPKGYPQEWEPHDVRSFEALPPYDAADFHPLDYEGGRLPGHRMAPKAYHEWEYESRFETGPPPLYEPDYRPDYDGQLHEGDRRYERGRHERDRERDRDARDRDRDVGPPPYHPADLPPPRAGSPY